VAVADGGGKAAYSTDGITWSAAIELELLAPESAQSYGEPDAALLYWLLLGKIGLFAVGSHTPPLGAVRIRAANKKWR
jgi:hypothetical protein